MSTLTVHYELTDEARKRIAVETGQVLPQSNKAFFKLEDLTPDQRAVVMQVAWINQDRAYLTLKESVVSDSYNWRQISVSSRDAQLDALPTIESLIAFLTSTAERQAAIEAEVAALRETKRVEHIREHIQHLQKNFAEQNFRVYISATEYNDHADEPEYAELAAARDAYLAAKQQDEDEKHAAEQAKAHADAERKAAQDQVKLEWVEQHGSDYLKRAIAAGHPCDRRYWNERAALEYQGFVVDFDATHDSKDRVCPSDKVLDLRDEVLANHPHLTPDRVQIVWLTAAPDDSNNDNEEFEEREAIVVNDPNYSKWLIQTV